MKKIISILLTFVMFFSMVPYISAVDELTVEEKFDVLRGKGVFDGYGDCLPHLDDDMLREQAAKVITLLFILNPLEPPETGTYSDVKIEGNWAYPYIEVGTAAGIIDGIGKGLFDPKNNVTKEQFAKLLVVGYANYKGLEIDESGYVGPSVSGWAQKYVAQALEWKLINEQEDYKIDGDRNFLVDSAYETYIALDIQPNLELPHVVDYKDATTTSVTLIFSEDIEVNDDYFKNYFHTCNAYPVDEKDKEQGEISIDGNELTLTFKENKFPEGKVYIYIKKGSVNDLMGDLNDFIVVEIEVKKIKVTTSPSRTTSEPEPEPEPSDPIEKPILNSNSDNENGNNVKFFGHSYLFELQSGYGSTTIKNNDDNDTVQLVISTDGNPTDGLEGLEDEDDNRTIIIESNVSPEGVIDLSYMYFDITGEAPLFEDCGQQCSSPYSLEDVYYVYAIDVDDPNNISEKADHTISANLLVNSGDSVFNKEAIDLNPTSHWEYIGNPNRGINGVEIILTHNLSGEEKTSNVGEDGWIEIDLTGWADGEYDISVKIGDKTIPTDESITIDTQVAKPILNNDVTITTNNRDSETTIELPEYSYLYLSPDNDLSDGLTDLILIAVNLQGDYNLKYNNDSFNDKDGVTLYIYAYDSSGNFSEPAANTIFVDTVAPNALNNGESMDVSPISGDVYYDETEKELVFTNLENNVKKVKVINSGITHEGDVNSNRVEFDFSYDFAHEATVVLIDEVGNESGETELSISSIVIP
ncbi:S-layer homology domain-containing protein [Chengkuizengella sediminis]|uniref:S-layer homology domain-containing protein n=1 Tax=Chengkuizengella sediminis TaxID=1885917 RepID=UPI00138A5BF3|nr:S-layer homology domain-containing protein [Chengkuizengella sediminis]NDI35189.1 S-layer homology domain-containing protein [Chengkuizengella sediminis]